MRKFGQFEQFDCTAHLHHKFYYLVANLNQNTSSKIQQ